MHTASVQGMAHVHRLPLRAPLFRQSVPKRSAARGVLTPKTLSNLFLGWLDTGGIEADLSDDCQSRTGLSQSAKFTLRQKKAWSSLHQNAPISRGHTVHLTGRRVLGFPWLDPSQRMQADNHNSLISWTWEFRVEVARLQATTTFTALSEHPKRFESHSQ